MPIHKLLKSVAVISLGAVIGYTTMKFFKPEQKNRFIASYPITKMGKEQDARALFDIKINADDIALTEDGVSTIKVSIQAFKDFNAALLYNWNLPKDVDVVDGFLSENLGEFKENQIKEYTLRVRGFSKHLKKFISFEIEGELNQRPVRREVLISSRIEDSFEHAIQQNELNRSKKNINKLDAGKSKNKFSPENVVR